MHCISLSTDGVLSKVMRKSSVMSLFAIAHIGSSKNRKHARPCKFAVRACSTNAVQCCREPDSVKPVVEGRFEVRTRSVGLWRMIER